jgi:cell division transport system permease protein
MALNVNYVARETAQNLARNPTLTVASIITVAVSLTFAGVGLLVRQGIDNLAGRFQEDVELIIFLDPDISAEQRKALQSSLEANPEVKDFTYFNQEQAYEEAKKLFQDQPSTLEILRVEDVPPSFRVEPTNPDFQAVVALRNLYQDEGGVREVASATEAIRAIQEMSDKLNLGVWVAAVALGLNAILLIYNTIRTAMFARRREIEVMKLVGATNWFIRVPFMLEGLVQALIGGLVAILGLQAVNKWGFHGLANNEHFELFREFEFDTATVIKNSIAPILIGVFIGMVGSGFAVTRYLDV